MLMRLRHPFDVRYGARQHVFQIVFNCCSIVFAVVSQPGACVLGIVRWCGARMRCACWELQRSFENTRPGDSLPSWSHLPCLYVVLCFP
jgi:hypothetical protein